MFEIIFEYLKSIENKSGLFPFYDLSHLFFALIKIQTISSADFFSP